MTMGVMRLDAESRMRRVSSGPSGKGMRSPRNTMANLPRSRMSKASALFVRLRESMPTEFRTFSISWQVAGSSSTISALFSILGSSFSSIAQSGGSRRARALRRRSPLVEYRHVSGNSGSRWEMRLLRARDIVAIKVNADAEPALGRFDRFGANDVAGAAPLCSRLAGNFFGHLQENFDDFAFGE